jgi:hypothetical protein
MYVPLVSVSDTSIPTVGRWPAWQTFHVISEINFQLSTTVDRSAEVEGAPAEIGFLRTRKLAFWGFVERYGYIASTQLSVVDCARPGAGDIGRRVQTYPSTTF